MPVCIIVKTITPRGCGRPDAPMYKFMSHVLVCTCYIFSEFLRFCDSSSIVELAHAFLTLLLFKPVLSLLLTVLVIRTFEPRQVISNNVIF